MRYNRIRIIPIIFFSIAVLSRGVAQDFESLPKLTPSYKETFSDYKSNPSLCFNMAFFDEEGRMWLTPCSGTQIGLHLFQFDGYEFTAVRGSLDKLPTNTRFFLMDDDRGLIGYVHDPAKPQIVAFDPDADVLDMYELPVTGINEVQKVFFSDSGTLTIVASKENRYLQFELQEDAVVLTQDIQHDFNKNLTFIKDFGEVEAGMWHFAPSFDQVIKFDISNGQSKIYKIEGIEPFEKDEGRIRPFYGKLYVSADNYYLTLIFPGTSDSRVWKLEGNSDRFVEVEGLPGGSEEIQVFTDDNENVIFLFRYPDNSTKGILEDGDGQRYDCSSFFSQSQGLGAIIYLESPDFKEQLLICHSQGIQLQTVKAFNAISTALEGNSLRTMVELPGQRTLIFAQSNTSKYIFDHKSGIFESWMNPDCNMAWAKVLKDEDGFLWGVGMQSIIKYDPHVDECETFPAPVHRNIIEIIDDNQIAFTTKDHLALIDLKTGDISTCVINGEPLTLSGFVHDMHYSKAGVLWIATSKGLIKVDLDQKTSEVIGLNDPFLDFRFLCIHEDENGRLWLGTPLGGIHIYNPDNGQLKIINSESGLANNMVVSILADDDGDRWIGTYNGISIVSSQGELISNLYVDDGLVDREANRYSYLKTSDGRLLIGTVKGLNIIEPRDVKQRLLKQKDLKIYLTSVGYFDAHDDKPVLKRYGIANLGRISLPANRKNIRLKFAVSNYFKPEFNQYAYQLEGISEDWIPLGNQNSLILNDMPSGRYRLLIRGSDGTGNWTRQPLSLNIYAGEYFYKQTWFYLLCIGLAGGFVFLWIQRLRSAVRKATKIIREDKAIIEQQAEELLELDHAKSRFFTNISHEFRTPLTIISGMAGQIMDNPQSWAHKGSKMIKQNSTNLLNLVNQILDLRKLEAKELKLNMVQGDIVKYLGYLARSYRPYASSMGLNLHFLPAVDRLVMDYDPEKLMRIISNLLSNAVKYTPDKGNVYFHVNQLIDPEQSFIQIRIDDTGAGIPEDHLPHIFDRFYQVDNSNLGKHEGTGIGLALTKELVQLMNGSIGVKSTHGKGTTFTIRLPITNESPVKEAHVESLTSPEIPAVSEEIIQSTGIKDQESVVPSEGDLPTLLIVEDNADIRQFLIACLEEKYRLVTATDGQEGIDKALENVPDLIISDVMMPVKDGFELCATLKEDHRTSHIPIILLTAKTDRDSKLSGLKTGADAYLTKPFEQEELLIRLEKLFELREKLRARYRSLDPESLPENKEDEFVQKVRQAVLSNISDETFGIAQLCRAIALSRAQLHNKIKALTGQSTSHFVRSIRLKKAKELLETSDMNVSEVGYEVGFKNPSHFSSAFHEEYGVAPSKTRK